MRGRCSSIPNTSSMMCSDEKQQHQTPAVTVVQNLIEFLEQENSNTFQEFDQKIRKKIVDLKGSEASAEVECVTEIFLRYISLRTAHFNVFKEAKIDLRQRGKFFLENVSQSKQRVAKIGQTFVSDGSTILVHSFSRVVLFTLIEAHRLNKRIMVFVTQSSPLNSGELMHQRLKEEGIRCRLITDSAIGFFMDKVDVVLVGAEAVAKNGGIINQIGAYPLAVCAKAVNKPFYVLVESYKFSKLYPLKQEDIPKHLQFRDNAVVDEDTCSVVDYTPPQYVTLLITDLGPLATAAVSDVLMQLYI